MTKKDSAELKPSVEYTNTSKGVAIAFATLVFLLTVLGVVVVWYIARKGSAL